MKLLFFLIGIIGMKAQTSSLIKSKNKLLVEFSVCTDFSAQVSELHPAIGLGIWYRYPVEDGARLELGGNVKTGNNFYNFDYGKEGNNYHVTSKAVIINLGGRLIKEFSIRKQKVEWINELTFNTLIFEGKDIPNSSRQAPENSQSIGIVIDAESISTLQIGQGFRIWRRNMGIGIKANFAPYSLWYLDRVPNQFNVFSTEAMISLKF